MQFHAPCCCPAVALLLAGARDEAAAIRASLWASADVTLRTQSYDFAIRTPVTPDRMEGFGYEMQAAWEVSVHSAAGAVQTVCEQNAFVPLPVWLMAVPPTCTAMYRIH